MLNFTGADASEVLVVLYDAMGREIYSKVILDGTGTQSGIFAIDPQQKLSPGIYFIQASSNDKLCKQKLVVY